ncbi:MAG: N-formylglutamate amidohydrolase [Phyllobacterium sp.]
MTGLTKTNELLHPDEPEPLEVFNPDGASEFVIICEHAGRLIPRSLGTLGLSEEDRKRHIAWDIGARDIAVALSGLLDAPLFMQRYSRLVCDCNRQPDVASFAPDLSEWTEIPGNRDLSVKEIELRRAEIFDPFHDGVAKALDTRETQNRRTFLVTIHSFTPTFKGVSRPWEIGVLFNRDRHFSPAIVEYLQQTTDYCVGVNEPYAVSDNTDYAIPVHGEQRNIPCVEFEIRNDLTESDGAAAHWARLIAASVVHASAKIAPL